MQWMTMTSLVPCHALHAPQHAAASPFGSLNQSNDFFRPSYRSRLYIAGIGKSRYLGFCLELPSPRWIADQGLRARATYQIPKPLNQRNDFFRPSYQSRLYIAGIGKSRYVGFCLELPSPR